MIESSEADLEESAPEAVAPSHPESAARHLVTRVPTGEAADTIEAAVGRLAEGDHELVDAVYVVDEARRFLGAVRLPDLYRAPRGAKLGERMDRAYPRVGIHSDQEHVAAEALARRASSVAVVDDDGRLVGVVPALALLDVLLHEHVEDLHRLAGIQREQMRDLRALEAPPLRRARHRLPWLLVGLAGSLLAALVMARFEAVLERSIAVAFFVPAIVYLADAIGTQTEAIVVRGLSLSRLPLRRLLVGELRTGLLIGLSLAALSFPIVTLAVGDVRLGIAVATAILAAGGAATTIGLLFPWMLQRMGSDPAFGSGPVATIVQDVLSLVIYFAIATLVMR